MQAATEKITHPWEGTNGHLWLRDLFLMLRDDGQDATEIAYALGKPWKYAADVERFRDRKNEEAARG